MSVTTVLLQCSGCGEHAHIPTPFVQLTWAAGQWDALWTCPTCNTHRQSVNIAHGHALGIVHDFQQQIQSANPRDVTTDGVRSVELPTVPAWHPDSPYHQPTCADDDPEFRAALERAKQMDAERQRDKELDQ